ncbi:MAG: hypothetical protein LBU60_00230 [Clostridiales bacterium]|jgi:hypothetical protein|nr:hypothetical protein [Clostridiales bacterium]
MVILFLISIVLLVLNFACILAVKILSKRKKVIVFTKYERSIVVYIEMIAMLVFVILNFLKLHLISFCIIVTLLGVVLLYQIFKIVLVFFIDKKTKSD